MEESEGPPAAMEESAAPGAAMADGGNAPEADAVGSSDAPLVPSRFVGTALFVLFLQFVLIVYLLSPLPVPSVQVLAFSALGLSFVAALLVGADAYRTGQDDTVDWSPNPFLWAIPMFFPLLGFGLGVGQALGIPLGVGIAYAVRRFQTQRRGLERIWQWPAVGAGVFSGAGFGIVSVAVSESGGLTPSLVGVLLVASVLFGFTTPATYYDTRHVKRRLAANGDDWLFGGYHWVVAMSLPLPLRSLVALAYALRRWMLLNPGGFFWSKADPTEGDDDKS
jgi:hypothetical protein